MHQIFNLRIKVTTEGSQETKLREDKNSEREEQSVKPQQQDHPKDYDGIKPLTHPTSSLCPQRIDNFIPTTQSTLSTLEPSSKCPNYASQEFVKDIYQCFF